MSHNVFFCRHNSPPLGFYAFYFTLFCPLFQQCHDTRLKAIEDKILEKGDNLRAAGANLFAPFESSGPVAQVEEYQQREALYNSIVDAINALLAERRAIRNESIKDSTSLKSRYPLFHFIKEDIDIYSLRTVMPDRKSEMNGFWWEGELFYYPGWDNSQKQADFTFILDQDMLLLPFLYVMKDLTGTTTGQYRAPRGNVLTGDYSQEFDFGVYQIATDRNIVTAYAQLKGVRVYEVGGIKTDKSDTGTTVQTVTVKCAWDYTNWDDSMIGRPWYPQLVKKDKE